MRGKSDTTCKATRQRHRVREREGSKMGDVGEWPRCGGSSWWPEQGSREQGSQEQGSRVKMWRRNLGQK